MIGRSSLMRFFLALVLVGRVGSSFLDQRALEPDGILAEPRHTTPRRPSKPLPAQPLKKEAEKVEKEEKKIHKTAKDDVADILDEGEEVTDEDNLSFATIIGIGSTVILGMTVFSMASNEDKAVAKNTWLMLDMVVAIFIAVLWYQAVAAGIERLEHWAGLDKKSSHFRHVAHFLHAFCLFMAAVFVSFKIRQNKRDLGVFCACGAHFVSFASVGYAVSMQERMEESYEGLGVMLAVPLLAVVLVLLYVFFGQMRAHTGMNGVDDEWEDAIDDVENDYFAMALAVVLTLTVNYLIVGKYNNLEDIEGIHTHTPLERRAMLIYAVLLLPTGAFIASKVAGIGEASQSSSVKKACAVTVSVICMMVAWAFLQAGQWEVAMISHGEHAIVRRLQFAVAATACSLLMVYGLAKMQNHASGRLAAEETALAKVGLVATGLVTGFSWEQVFNEAIETLAEGHTEEFILKMFLAVGVGIFVIPMYVFYFKPVVNAKTGD